MIVMINIYLDDTRAAPDNFILVKTAHECIALLKKLSREQETCNILSLDHDLGDDDKGTGYDVLLWIEERSFHDKDFIIPRQILIHSSNSSAKVKMNLAIISIMRIYNERA